MECPPCFHISALSGALGIHSAAMASPTELLELHVHVISARSLHKTHTLGAQHPFVSVRIGHEEHKTAVFKDGGADPTFNERMVLRAVLDDVVHFHCVHVGLLGGNTPLAEGSLSVSRLATGDAVECWLPLTHTGKEGVVAGGELQLRLHLTRSGGVAIGGASASTAAACGGAGALPDQSAGPPAAQVVLTPVPEPPHPQQQQQIQAPPLQYEPQQQFQPQFAAAAPAGEPTIWV